MEPRQFALSARCARLWGLGVGLLGGLGSACDTSTPVGPGVAPTTVIVGQPMTTTAAATNLPTATAQPGPVAGGTGVTAQPPAAPPPGPPMPPALPEPPGPPMAGTGSSDPVPPPAGVALQSNCQTGDVGPCGSFQLSLSGMTLELGPLGAWMDVNAGEAFPASVSSSDTVASCERIAASFGEPDESSGSLLDIASLDLSLYTVYRPAIVEEGATFPLIVWGNGTCAQPEGYGALLRYVASHGYVVVAPNSRFTGYEAPMSRALDFMFAANEDPESPYYQQLDLENVGAMGHSQGGMATQDVANDPRVTSVILWNGGSSASKPFLAVTGETDIGSPTASGLADAVRGSSTAQVAWLYYRDVPQTGSVSGHLTLMTQPERVVEPTVQWWDMMLKGDASARDWLINDACLTCGAHEFGHKGL